MNLRSALDQEFWRGHISNIVSAGGKVAVILVIFIVARFVLYRVIGRVIRTITKGDSQATPTARDGRVRTLGSLMYSVVFYVLVFISVVQILDAFGVDSKSVLTTAGVVGLAFGFGAQKLVRDIISGFFVVLENQYSVGEYVTIGAVTGTVTDLGMRVTRLRDDVGKLVIIANGDVSIVTNHSRGPILASLEINVVPDTDLDAVRSIVESVADDVAAQVEGVLSPPKVAGVTAVDAAKVSVRVTCEVRHGRQEAVQSALRERLRTAFAERGIRFA